MNIFLPDENATGTFARVLARVLLESGPERVLLFQGPLGAGKTTLIRQIVAALPGGEKAEVSSPSFNIMNIYPTEPESVHLDLYRLEGLPLDEDAREALESETRLVLVEWPEFLNPDDVPDEHLRLVISPQGEARRIRITAAGKSAAHLLDRLNNAISADPKSHSLRGDS